uniref:Uncharacterized protein n=1 Tax=Musca domestica TaxID=7370 RepID=A0A1I8MM55_MUSDO
MEQQTFHQSVRKILFISQCFGLLPVSNLWQKNVNKLKFKWVSIPSIYSGVILVLDIMEFGVVIYYIWQTGVNFHTSGTVSLFFVCIWEHIIFWRLALKWPKLMRQWRQVEELFLQVPYQLYVTFNMKFWIWFWYLLIMFGGSCEHVLLVFNSFQKSDLERRQCNLNVSYWETLYGRERPHLSMVIPFQYWTLPIYEWLNLTLAYPRSFTDVFIIIISIGLAARFHQLHLRMKAVQGK